MPFWGIFALKNVKTRKNFEGAVGMKFVCITGGYFCNVIQKQTMSGAHDGGR